MDRKQLLWLGGGLAAVALSLGVASVLALILYVVLFALAFGRATVFSRHRRN